MSLGTILLTPLVVLLITRLSTWRQSDKWGEPRSGAMSVAVIVLLLCSSRAISSCRCASAQGHDADGRAILSRFGDT